MIQRPSDFVTIALLVALEGLLSADNAMVLAVLVLGLPQAAAAEGASLRHRRRVRCSAASRRCSRSYLIQLALGEAGRRRLPAVPAVPALLPERRRRDAAGAAAGAGRWLGLSAFWATVVKVELTDIVFAIDSILVAVAMSPKLWVILTGGILGIVAMRLVIGQLLTLVRALSAARRRRVRHHRVGRHQAAARVCAPAGTGVDFEVPRWLSLG